ncbi:MAG: cyclodeaminase/cyclohydrolase family protein [Armatimonadota bacterium]|nr:cyclodeaminase/cyclohydrolase family protein [Armatimonadota bacterium]
MYPEFSVTAFLDALASAAPEPGGGAAAALAGATGAALVSMVANLTIGKAQYAAAQREMEQAREAAETLRARLTAAIDRDSEAFRQVMKAYGLPRGTDDEKAARKTAIQQALKAASSEPAEVVRLCRDVAAWSRVTTEKGNVQAVSDAAVAALFADAAAQAAALNVKINLKSITDAAFNEALWVRVQADLDDIRRVRDDVLALTEGRLR